MADTPTVTQKSIAREAEASRRSRRVPYVGALVLYVDPGMGDIYPALVIRVHNADVGRVTLTTFPPRIAPFPARELVMRDHNKAKGTWHWIPDAVER